MAYYGDISILGTPVDSLLLVSGYQSNQGSNPYGTVKILGTPADAMIAVDNGSYRIAGTQQCPPVYEPPLWGQLYPRFNYGPGA